jgi:hypothetical protein
MFANPLLAVARVDPFMCREIEPFATTPPKPEAPAEHEMPFRDFQIDYTDEAIFANWAVIAGNDRRGVLRSFKRCGTADHAGHRFCLALTAGSLSLLVSRLKLLAITPAMGIFAALG